MDDNPLYDYLTDKQLVPQACIEPWLVYFLAMGSLFSAILAITFLEWRFTEIIPTRAAMVYAIHISWPIALLTPLVGITTAALLTSRVVYNDDFVLLILTNLSNRAIVSALTNATLYWLRAWLVLLIGFTPLLVGGLMNLYIVLSLKGVGIVAMPLFVTMSLWSNNYLAIVLAIGLTLRGRYLVVATLFSELVIIALNLLLLLLVLTPFVYPVYSINNWVLLGLFLMALPLVLAIVFHRLAEHWVCYKV